MERFVEDGSLDDNVESFLSHDDADPQDPIGRGMDPSKGILEPLIHKDSYSSLPENIRKLNAGKQL